MSTLSRVLAPATLAAGLLLGTVPAFAQSMTTPTACGELHFELANPAAGSQLDPGGLVVQGIAVDQRATSGTGIDHVDFFLGDRNEGGFSVGSTVPGSAPGPMGTFGSFQTTITLPNISGGNDIVAYAHSSVTGQEAVISIPVAIGESTTVAGETSANGSTPQMTESCSGTAPTTTSAPATTTTTTTTPATATTTPSTTTTTGTTTTPAQSLVSLEVANPSTGATVLSGAYVTQGTASAGVDRVDIFLDNRDEGGFSLGSATVGGNGMARGAWTATVDFPSNQKGLHTLWYYAHSTVTGAETAVQVPIDIE